MDEDSLGGSKGGGGGGGGDEGFRGEGGKGCLAELSDKCGINVDGGGGRTSESKFLFK